MPNQRLQYAVREYGDDNDLTGFTSECDLSDWLVDEQRRHPKMAHIAVYELRPVTVQPVVKTIRRSSIVGYVLEKGVK